MARIAIESNGTPEGTSIHLLDGQRVSQLYPVSVHIDIDAENPADGSVVLAFRAVDVELKMRVEVDEEQAGKIRGEIEKHEIEPDDILGGAEE